VSSTDRKTDSLFVVHVREHRNNFAQVLREKPKLAKHVHAEDHQKYATQFLYMM
jgi:hypothetical protein